MSRIRASELAMIYDSRGRPTVEATIVLDSGTRARAGAPSGASTGAHEVLAFPTGGVPEAISTFSSRVAPRLVGLDPSDRAGVDGALVEADGTSNFARIGGNSATAASVAAALAYACDTNQPLWRVLARPGIDEPHFPSVVGNCLNGGRHAIGGPDIQEFIAFAEGRRIEESIDAAIRVHRWIGAKLHERFPKAALGRGDEGGWVAPVGNVEAIELLTEACAAVRDELHVEVHPGIDLAASEFCTNGRYHYRDQVLDGMGQVAFVEKLVQRYGLRFVEDPFDQEAFGEFAELTRRVGDSTLVVGDDVYVSQEARVRRGLEEAATNAVLIKVNQVGTLSGTFATVDYARSRGAALIASHRSGETPDSWLAHLALGIGARGIKTGVLGGERVAKLNELLRLARPTGA
ncbi:MAG: enolase C-terminal domain-like protein [Thermoplasmata archaeon]